MHSTRRNVLDEAPEKGNRAKAAELRFSVHLLFLDIDWH